MGILKKIQEQVRFARARFGQYDLIDFVVVLIGYAVSGEPTLLAFYERLAPFAEPFMALFGRNLLPHRSTLSRFLAALDQRTVEDLRARFQEDLLARKPFAFPGGVFDRTGDPWLVVDVDGTRQTARQRALPQTESLPAPHRRFDQVCAPGGKYPETWAAFALKGEHLPRIMSTGVRIAWRNRSPSDILELIIVNKAPLVNFSPLSRTYGTCSGRNAHGSPGCTRR
jgi:hypothetical protein